MTFREKTRQIANSNITQNAIVVLIILNALSMGLETFSWWRDFIGQSTLVIIDWTFIIIFLLEILFKLYAYGPTFFKCGWNNFDFIVVAISLIPGNGVFSCFRTLQTLRIFRTTRLFGRIRNLRIIVNAMLKALPNIGWLLLLLIIFFYIFAVLTTTLFGQIAPEKFGNIFTSFYSLFSLMIMEGWQNIVEGIQSPYSKVVFIPFMLISSYIFLNLVVGIIVAAMEEMVGEDKQNQRDEEIKRLSDKLDHICNLLEKKDK